MNPLSVTFRKLLRVMHQIRNRKVEEKHLLTLQRGVMGTARMLHALTHSSISRQVREQM